ncbi:MAG: hypothetical protein B7X40_05675 [Cellulomonas sp. 14-74-6]|jgi:ribosome maturation factor RimP|nr:MAG: hypothetical protein B7X40_05675 [Cellulomonas sp. 14-74-6]
MAAATPERVRQLVAPAVERTGLVLEDVAVVGTGPRTVVRVTVDLTEDDAAELDLDRVALVHQAVSEALDDADVPSGPYTLEVSSPDVARPLTQRRHYVRAVGRSVRLRLDDGSEVVGRLDRVDGPADDTVAVVVPVTSPGKGRRPVEGPPQQVPVHRVVDGRVEVDLKGLGPVEEPGPDGEDVAGTGTGDDERGEA